MKRAVVLALLFAAGCLSYVAPAGANGCASTPPGGRCATTTLPPTTVPSTTTVPQTTTSMASTTTTDPSTTTDPTTPCIPPNGEPHACDPLPKTGFELPMWLGIAFVALFVGAYLVAVNGRTGRERPR